MNLHKTYLEKKYDLKRENEVKLSLFTQKMNEVKKLSEISHLDLVKLSSDLYESGYSCLDLIEWVKEYSDFSTSEKSRIVLCFDNVRYEYRCEKLLLLYMFDFIFLRSNKDLKNIGFI
jgi:hypothetical protein